MTRAVEAIAEDLRALGLESGDIVLAKASVRSLRLPSEEGGAGPKSYASELLEGIIAAVSPGGTVLGMTFSPEAVLPQRKSARHVFSSGDQPNTGGLARAFVRHKDAVRSAHPTNSFTGIGPEAEEILRFHTPFSYTHRPIEELVERGGKMLIIGCIVENPGFSTVHLAQYHLGLSQRSLLVGWPHVDFVDPYGTVRTFRKHDIPACSVGFGKMYPKYREAGILSEGDVCGSPSMLIEAPAAYEIDYAALLADPLSLHCDDAECISCQYLKHYDAGPDFAGLSLVGKKLAAKLVRRSKP